MEKRWVLKEDIEQKRIDKLSKELNHLSPILSKLLIQRGIETFNEARDFFRPNIKQLHSPFLMKDMDLAVQRLQKAINSGEKIMIYGDYDVDGTTAVALVYSFLKKHHSNIDYYIPDRYSEGYGISLKGIDYASQNGFSLIIALDCGIKAVEQIAYAKEKNIDFLICDHHTPGEQIPKAAAILDPKRHDCKYPFKELSGCGIGFKLMQAYAEKENIPYEQLDGKLDILAVSICADIVPIIGENRILTYFGLKKLNQNPQKGFKAMLDIAQNKKAELTVTDVVFTIAPRINAAGRIESGKKAVEAILSDNQELAFENATSINANNTDRKSIDKAITEEALAMIENDNFHTERKSTVLFQPHWHKGVIGIVASRCIETYYKPTIILTESNGKITGSARSVKGFNIYEALEKCSNELEQFGGHKYAAGMTLRKENIEVFRQKFEEVVSSTIKQDSLIPEIEVDSIISLSEITTKFNRVLKQFAPYGPENMKPTFLCKKLEEKGYARIVGSKHLKLDFIDPTNQTSSFPAIAFNLGNKLKLVQSKVPLDVLFTIEENEWNGNKNLQLNVKDIKASAENRI